MTKLPSYRVHINITFSDDEKGIRPIRFGLWESARNFAEMPYIKRRNFAEMQEYCLLDFAVSFFSYTFVPTK